MKVVFQKSKLIFKKVMELVGLFTYQFCSGSENTLQENPGRCWCPSDNANSLAVGKYIYGIECRVGVAGAAFDVFLADFASPAAETWSDDSNATREKIASFTTTKNTGTEKFYFEEPVFISDINKRIGVEEKECFKWGGEGSIAGYKYVVQYKINEGTPQTIKYPWCSKLFFNLLVKE